MARAFEGSSSALALAVAMPVERFVEDADDPLLFGSAVEGQHGQAFSFRRSRSLSEPLPQSKCNDPALGEATGTSIVELMSSGIRPRRCSPDS